MNKGKNSSFNNKDKNELKMVEVNCEYCDQPFSQDGLKSHVNEFHKALKCGDCKKHHLFGKCEKKYLCQFCNKSFYGKDYYINHIKTVHEIVSLDQKDHKCELCEKSFSQSANLKKHVTTVHKGDKKFKCQSFHKEKLAVTAQEFLFPFEDIYCCRYGTYLQVNCFFYP